MNIDRSTVVALATLALVSILTVVTYIPGLSGPLLLDDLPQLEPLIQQSAHYPAELFGNYISSTSGPTGRPVAMATFIADAVTHGPDVWWWKYNNLMLHLTSGLLVCWLTALLLQALPKKAGVDPWIAGVVVGGLWLLHPIQVSTVLYTVQRMTELSTLFVFAGLVCYVKGRLLHDRSALSGWMLIGIGFFVFYPLGVFSKENALIYPVYCSLLELIVFQFSGPLKVRRQVKIFHGVLLTGYVLAAVLVLANFSSIVLESYAIRDFTLGERVLTQFRVVATYLSQILLPMQRSMGFFHDDVAVSTGLFSPVTTLMSGLLVVSLVASGFIFRRTLPLFAFGILFFFASHVVESSVFGLELMFEHRNYTGTFGILIALMALALHAKKHLRVAVAVAVISLLALSFLTWQRSITWSTPESLYQYAYIAHPDSSRVNLVYANVYMAAGDFVRAREFLASVKPGLGAELHGLFFDCLEHKRIDENALDRIASLQSSVLDGHATSSADALVQEVAGGRCSAPRQSLVEALGFLTMSRSRSAGDTQSVLFTKAKLLESMSEIDAAVEQYVAAQGLSKNDALPLYLAADTLIRSGRLDEARDLLKEAYELEKSAKIQRKDAAQRVYTGLAQIYEAGKQYDEALDVYAEATTSMPGRVLFRINTAEILLRLQRYDEVTQLLANINGQNFVDMDQYANALQQISTKLSRLEK
jgi:tetratricopeptide (TPR) repeat protein